jgi:hypothetical protein
MYKSEYFQYLRDRGMSDDEAIAQIASQYERRKPEEIEDLRRELLPQDAREREASRDLHRMQALFDQMLAEGFSENAAVNEVRRRHGDMDPLNLADYRRKLIDDRVPEPPTDTAELSAA